MSATIRAALFFSITTLLALPALAAPILPITASTDMGSGLSTNLQNTVNGVGLDGGQSSSAIHGSTNHFSSWVSASGILTGTVTFNLGGDYSVDGFTFWNENGGGPGTDGITGIQDVEVLTSLDGVTFTALPDGPTSFAQVTGSPASGQQISFVPVTASFIEFDILRNYGDVTQTGFAEVLFDGSAVPLVFCLGLSLIAFDRSPRVAFFQSP